MKESVIDKMKNYSSHTHMQNYTANLIVELYEQIKHGDQEHQDWLMEEVLNFIDKRVYQNGR